MFGFFILVTQPKLTTSDRKAGRAPSPDRGGKQSEGHLFSLRSVFPIKPPHGQLQILSSRCQITFQRGTCLTRTTISPWLFFWSGWCFCLTVEPSAALPNALTLTLARPARRLPPGNDALSRCLACSCSQLTYENILTKPEPELQLQVLRASLDHKKTHFSLKPVHVVIM